MTNYSYVAIPGDSSVCDSVLRVLPDGNHLWVSARSYVQKQCFLGSWMEVHEDLDLNEEGEFKLFSTSEEALKYLIK